MRLGSCAIVLLLAVEPAAAVAIDRISVVVNNHPVKASDIDRDIRITDFLNGDPAEFSEPSRKKAAQRLVDQQLIRREVQVGGYPKPTPEECARFLETIVKQRFHGSDGEYRTDLQKYGITDQQLRAQLSWQISVLHFIEQRFRPAILASEDDVAAYLRQHAAQFKALEPPEAHDAARERLTEERVNEAFEKWLDEAHQTAQIEYHEAGLQ